MKTESENLGSATSAPSFKVGDHATFVVWTDRHAGFVVGVSPNGKTVKFREGKATLLNGMNSGAPDALVCYPGGYCGHVEGTQRWAVEEDPTGHETTFTLRKNGAWKAAGHPMNSPGASLYSGHSHHHDFNF